jgi:hypothetical protein
VQHLRSFTGAAHLLRQHDGVKSADHCEHGSTTDHTRGKCPTNMPGHLRFARERAVARQFRLLVILARELAVGGDACDELAGFYRRPGALEQMLPEFQEKSVLSVSKYPQAYIDSCQPRP